MKERGMPIKDIEASDAFKRLHPDKKDNFRKSQSPVRPDITPLNVQTRLVSAMAEASKGNPGPLEVLYSTHSSVMSKDDAESATDVLSGKKVAGDKTPTLQLVSNRFPGNKKRASAAYSTIARMEAESGKEMTTPEKIKVIDDIIMLNLKGGETDHIQLSGAMYSGWQGGSSKQRQESGIAFENLSSQIGKEIVREQDTVTNAKALGRVLEWKTAQTSTGKKLSDEDVQKRYKAEVQYSDYEEYLTLTDYADVRATFDRIDSVIEEDFEPEDRQKIFNELRKVHKDAAYSLFLRGDSPRNVKAYGELLQSGAGRATTLQKYLKKAK
jgi:hypothetical protein